MLRTGPKETNVGELELPEQAGFPWSDRGMRGHMAAYFRSQMYGDSLSEPMVQYYVMGSVDEAEAGGNEWREAEDWPIPVRPKDSKPSSFCLSSSLIKLRHGSAWLVLCSGGDDAVLPAVRRLSQR